MAKIWLTKHTLILLLAVLCACAGQEASDTALSPNVPGSEVSLFIDCTEPGLPTPDDPTILRTRFVKINFDLLGGADAPPRDESEVASALILNLFEDVVFTAVIDRIELSSSGSFSWIGHLEGVEYSQVILVVKDRVMVGNITTPEVLYQVRYARNGVHAIHQIDQAAFPPEAEPVTPDR